MGRDYFARTCPVRGRLIPKSIDNLEVCVFVSFGRLCMLSVCVCVCAFGSSSPEVLIRNTNIFIYRVSMVFSDWGYLFESEIIINIVLISTLRDNKLWLELCVHRCVCSIWTNSLGISCTSGGSVCVCVATIYWPVSLFVVVVDVVNVVVLDMCVDISLPLCVF